MKKQLLCLSALLISGSAHASQMANCQVSYREGTKITSSSFALPLDGKANTLYFPVVGADHLAIHLADGPAERHGPAPTEVSGSEVTIHVVKYTGDLQNASTTGVASVSYRSKSAEFVEELSYSSQNLIVKCTTSEVTPEVFLSRITAAMDLVRAGEDAHVLKSSKQNCELVVNSLFFNGPQSVIDVNLVDLDTHTTYKFGGMEGAISSASAYIDSDSASAHHFDDSKQAFVDQIIDMEGLPRKGLDGGTVRVTDGSGSFQCQF